jgi:Tfp pilus assembly protein PilO
MSTSKSVISARADLADLAGLAVLIGLTALFAFGVFMPLTLRSRQAQTQADETARQRQRANALASLIRDAKADLERVQTRLASTRLRIDPPDALNERLSQLIAAGGEHHLSLTELKPGEAVATKRYTITPIRLTGAGAYPDVARFLHQLHQRLPDLAVAGFKLERGDNDSGVGRCELEFRWIARSPSSPAAPPVAVATVP